MTCSYNGNKFLEFEIPECDIRECDNKEFPNVSKASFTREVEEACVVNVRPCHWPL
jgi:hypothetical protein